MGAGGGAGTVAPRAQPEPNRAPSMTVGTVMPRGHEERPSHRARDIASYRKSGSVTPTVTVLDPRHADRFLVSVSTDVVSEAFTK